METQLLKDVINTEVKDLIELRLKIVRYLTIFEFFPLLLGIMLCIFINNRIIISIIFVIAIFFILVSDYFLFKIFHSLKLSKKLLTQKELKIIEIVGFNYEEKNVHDIREIITKYVIKNTSDKSFEELMPDLLNMVKEHKDKVKLESLIEYRKKMI